MAKKPTLYVSTPLFYPSGELHIGHAYSASLAWVIRNYFKDRGYETFFVTGADEHGQKIAQSAEQNQVSPQTYVDKMSQNFKTLWQDLAIDYDFFVRTTNVEHVTKVQKVFAKLIAQKNVYPASYRGLYSVADEEYFLPSQAKAKDGKYYHPQSGHELVELQEPSHFLKVSHYQNWWEKTFPEQQRLIFPPKVYRELNNNFVQPGLHDLSITRQNLSWGVPTAPKSSETIYVWVDALLGYLTSLGYLDKSATNFPKFWRSEGKIIHVIGKEISRFHAIYWPILLKCLDLTLPTQILAHGWITTKTGKMSKSKGNVVSPYKLLEKFSPEVVKYYLTTKFDVENDHVFDEGHLVEVYNSELVNAFGNLVSRTLALALKKCGGKIELTKDSEWTSDEKKLTQTIKDTYAEYESHFAACHVARALSQVHLLNKKLNAYIDAQAPWQISDAHRFAKVISLICHGIYTSGLMLKVAMPTAMSKLLSYLGLKKWDQKWVSDWETLGQINIKKSGHLFERFVSKSVYN
ncbi:methionine--tRNA ligase [Mycoplasma sp. ATU-Cv-508]|uniref:methionine--tRNA ligase n=1 Tax=Mycoplasma sp. ATU-Cv-508 TaxID=2048001 RepID=UPI000FDEE466